MRFLTTRGLAPPAVLREAIFEGIAADGGLFVPESIKRWSAGDLARLSEFSLAELAWRVLRPYTQGDIDDDALQSIVSEALNFPLPVVEVEPGIYALELFHGPTLAFKDVGARLLARLMSGLHDGGEPLTVLVATSGDTGGAVGYAFNGVSHTQVVILYPDHRVSRTQEAQLTMFNDDPAANVRAYAMDGSFDDCQRLVKAAFVDPDLRRNRRLTSANSINLGRLLPQMVYYFAGVAQLGATSVPSPAIVSTPSGNFGNLTAGLMAKWTGLPIARFVAATNVNDVVPVYLSTGRFTPRDSIRTLANAMDVGHPSNFDRMRWLYHDDLEAMRHDVVGSRHGDEEIRATIRRVFDERGYLLDPHSAIGYLGLKRHLAAVGVSGGLFLATAHPAKFAEIVEPIIGQPIGKPAPLAAALARRSEHRRVGATLEALRGILCG